jgi:putative transposase
MYGQLRADIREIMRTLCGYKKVEIVSGAVCADHVHLLAQIPPKYAISEFMGYLKGKSALMIFDRHPEFGTKWNRHFWAEGYYVSTVGYLDEAAVKQYIIDQEENDKKTN